MTRRQRTLRFGAMALVIALGLAALGLASGIVLETLGVFLLLVGFLGLLMLLYLEVGLSEDRDRGRRGP
ncbi:MAG TPA: hypothetical protein VFY44_03085 [Thermoleophilaceae bacterium]|nr:hypothetical protein [Thermoleophilaceae bacterium]